MYSRVVAASKVCILLSVFYILLLRLSAGNVISSNSQLADDQLDCIVQKQLREMDKEEAIQMQLQRRPETRKSIAHFSFLKHFLIHLLCLLPRLWVSPQAMPFYSNCQLTGTKLDIKVQEDLSKMVDKEDAIELQPRREQSALTHREIKVPGRKIRVSHPAAVGIHRLGMQLEPVQPDRSDEPGGRTAQKRGLPMRKDTKSG